MADRRTIAIESIRRDATQTRAALNSERVGDYAERMKAGDEFPPPVVFHDGESHWLADGFHRVEAFVTNGRARIECEVRKGGRADAILFGATANAKHGLSMSPADKRRAVTMVLQALAEKSVTESDRLIAKRCGVSDVFVGTMRRELQTLAVDRPRVGADGRTRNPPKPRAPKPDDAPNAYVAIASALDAAGTRQEAEAAYTKLTHAAAAGDVSPKESEHLTAAYRSALARIESALADARDDEGDAEPEVFQGQDLPAPQPEPEKHWGSFDVGAHVFQIIAACRDFETRLRGLYDKADPKFAEEVRRRAQDTVLRLMKSLNDLLPPDGTKAELNRAKFGVISGGKGQ